MTLVTNEKFLGFMVLPLIALARSDSIRSEASAKFQFYKKAVFKLNGYTLKTKLTAFGVLPPFPKKDQTSIRESLSQRNCS